MIDLISRLVFLSVDNTHGLDDPAPGAFARMAAVQRACPVCATPMYWDADARRYVCPARFDGKHPMTEGKA